MKLLKELARIANLKRVNKIDVFDASSIKGKTNKFNTFYHNLVNQNYESDQDAAADLYNTTPIDDRYRQLKSRFRRRLFNTVFFINANTPAAGKFEQALADCQRDWALLQILRLYDGDLTVHYLARNIIQVAQKHHFTGMQLQCITVLMQLAFEAARKEEYHQLLLERNKLTQLLDAETESRTLLEMGLLDVRDTMMEVDTEYWKKVSERLVLLSETHPSPYTKYNSFLAGVKQYIAGGQPDLALLICHEINELLNANPLQFPVAIRLEAANTLLKVCLHSKQFAPAQEVIPRLIKSIQAGSESLSQLLHRYFVLAMHTAQYTQAFAIIQQVYQFSGYNRLSADLKALWNIHYVTICYFISTMPDLAQLKRIGLFGRFDPDAFLNEKPKLPKHLIILTLWTLILQLLFTLQLKRHVQADAILEELKLLDRKRLNPHHHARMIAAIRCFAYLAKSDYQVDNLKVNNKYFLQLLSLPMYDVSDLDQLEIIPFHTLWVEMHKSIVQP